MSAGEAETEKGRKGWGNVKRKLGTSAAAASFVHLKDVQSSMSELSTIFSGLGEWQITRHAQYLLDDTLAKVAEMGSNDMRKLCRELDVQVEGNLDDILADDLRSALEEHFRNASELIKKVGRGEKHGVWEDQHVVALLQGFRLWYDEPSGSANQTNKDFEERQEMLNSLSEDGVSHFTHAEKEQILHDLGLLDLESRGELMDVLAEIETLRAQQQQLDVAREVAQDAANAPPDEALQAVLAQIAEKEAEVARLSAAVEAALRTAGLGDELARMQAGQSKAMEVLVDAPGRLDASFSPAPNGRGVVVKAVTGRGGDEGAPLASSGLVLPGMVLLEVNGTPVPPLKHAAALTLIADTDAEPRRMLRFRSRERQAFLERTGRAGDEGRPSGEVTLRVETWMPLGASEGAPALRAQAAAEIVPLVRVVVERVSGLPPLDMADKDGAPYQVVPELGDDEVVIALPDGCEDGGAHSYAGGAVAGEFADASGGAADVGFRLVQEHTMEEYDGERVPLPWTADAPGATERAEERDGTSYKVLSVAGTFEVYRAGRRPEQLREKAAIAAGGGGGDGAAAAEDGVDAAGGRATFQGVTYHPGYGEDEAELFAPGEEDQATHIKRLGAVLRLKSEGSAAASAAQLSQQTEETEAEIASLRERVGELEQKLEEMRAKAEEETQAQRKELEEAQAETKAAREVMEEEQRKLEELLNSESEARSAFRKAEEQLETVMGEIERLDAQIQAVKEASVQVGLQAEEEISDWKKVSPGAFVRFFEFRTWEE